VSGPEILDKWVGEAERNVRALFYEAEREWDERGARSGLHVIIFDEMDALTRTRGSLTGDSSGVRDSVVNQLLAKLDGVKEMDNMLVIGLTNRRDLIDPALLRPGRLEVVGKSVCVRERERGRAGEPPGTVSVPRIHAQRCARMPVCSAYAAREYAYMCVRERWYADARESLPVPHAHATSQHLEIQAPDEAGRHEILGIHLRSLRSSDRLSSCASAAMAALAQDKTQGWSGAELAGLVRSATSFALQRALDELEASSPAAAAAASSGAAEAEAVGGGVGARGREERERSGISAVSRGALLQVQVCAEDLFRAHAEIDEARSLVFVRERVCCVWCACTHTAACVNEKRDMHFENPRGYSTVTSILHRRPPQNTHTL
jgi:SpoVK/Ycf46/Vps4 family AAA+-type ATPase